MINSQFPTAKIQLFFGTANFFLFYKFVDCFGGCIKSIFYRKVHKETAGNAKWQFCLSTYCALCVAFVFFVVKSFLTFDTAPLPFSPSHLLPFVPSGLLRALPSGLLRALPSGLLRALPSGLLRALPSQ
jgi:hypothetical protein